jgi:tRNA/tmRNA/rRNA uracil-C5-methylase (TrmA/RlmC/RlmD family)
MGKQHTRHTDGSPNGIYGKFDINHELGETYGDSGSASRFFYCAKASKRERNIGIDCYLTVKYNNLCKEENTVVVQLLKRVISDTEVVSFSTGESGENITVQCHKDSLSTILTEINKIIELKILNSLTHSLTNESTQDVNSEKESGGNLVESVESLRKYLLTITKENRELALGASRVALQTLLSIKEKENWQEAKNFHSTVKPIALMEYLVKLVSREGQVVLDPFMGSGTTGMACKKLNREFVGIEMMPEYMEIAKARIDGVKENKQLEQLNLLKDNK